MRPPSVSPVSGTLRFQQSLFLNLLAMDFAVLFRQCRRKVARSIRVLETSDSDGRKDIHDGRPAGTIFLLFEPNVIVYL